MAKYDHVGGCPCGLYAVCQCKTQDKTYMRLSRSAAERERVQDKEWMPGDAVPVTQAPEPAGAFSDAMHTMKPSNPKDAIGSDKLPLHLFPSTARAAGCLAFLEGALKYGRSNWRASGVRASIYKDACDGHMDAWFEGQDTDQASGLPHLTKALACIAILIDAAAAGKLNDDRMFNGSGALDVLHRENPNVAKLKDMHADKSPKHYTIADDAA